MACHLYKLYVDLLLQQTAKAVGALTEVLPTADKIGGLLVTKDFNSRLIAPQDLETYTQLKVSIIAIKACIIWYCTYVSSHWRSLKVVHYGATIVTAQFADNLLSVRSLFDCVLCCYY
jgi:Pre-mRNA 3'-end-processing endonuclease polyadenylation factor C-term